MHVRQPRARESRLEVGEPLGDDVECVETAMRAHQRAQQQRLASGAGAEIDDHVAALRRDQKADQLAALVLDLDRAVLQQRMLGELRPPGDPQPERRVGRRFGGDAERRQRAARGVTRRLQRIHAEVERRGSEQRAGECRAFLFAERVAEACPQPVGKVRGDGGRERRREARLECAQPDGIGFLQHAFQLPHAVAEFPRDHGEREFRRMRRLGQLLQGAPATQVRIHAFGDERPVVLAHRRMAAEEMVEQVVGRGRERLDFRDRSGQSGDLVGPQRHCCASASSTRIESSSASKVPRLPT